MEYIVRDRRDGSEMTLQGAMARCCHDHPECTGCPFLKAFKTGCTAWAYEHPVQAAQLAGARILRQIDDGIDHPVPVPF